MPAGRVRFFVVVVDLTGAGGSTLRGPNRRSNRPGWRFCGGFFFFWLFVWATAAKVQDYHLDRRVWFPYWQDAWFKSE